MIEFDILNTTVFLVLFTVAFILMDEYIAKPIRHRRIAKLKERDPEWRRILEEAVEAHKKAGN